jgi:hypothetical protein
MEKILLAIEGVAHDRSTFRYALALCKHMHNILDILQILTLRCYEKYLKKSQAGHQARQKFF